jgi:Thiamine pyrophosphate-requiring enzymes [acetolactate synthase, pyruvate dehydrogenase (cytochrome), glyoxylate carboligase, phosphonopyruvate decarboxylase]
MSSGGATWRMAISGLTGGSRAIVTTSVGPGATNLATALATAYVDSSTFIAITGQIQTYLFGMGIFQEIERKNWVDYVNAMNHLAKRSWLVTSVKQLQRVFLNALKEAVSGRPGPVLIDLPMDVQVDRVETELEDPSKYLPTGRVYPDPIAVKRAAELLLMAEKPLILIGGGVVMSGATEELVRVAEFLGAPVICSFRGDAKGGFPEDHELYAFHPGNIGSLVGNELAKEADVILAVGVTFSDETTSSYVRGVTFNIPPTKLIHIDVDPHEIGKNYPVEIGIVGDAKASLEMLYRALIELGVKRDWRSSQWYRRFKELKDRWFAEIEELRSKAPMGIPNIVKILREELPRDTIITLSAGLPQEIFSQQWISYYPGTFISSGGFSTMGFALPAAMGAKLAKPERKVVAIEGDGSFLMNSVELSTAKQYEIPVLVVVLNNYGWVSIRDLQIRSFKERIIATEFRDRRGNLYTIDFEKIVRAYGVEYMRAASVEEVRRGVRKLLGLDAPSVLEIPVETRFPYSGTKAYGYWDIPSKHLAG